MRLSYSRYIVLGALLGCLVGSPAVAERQTVDRVVAVVEDEAIFQSDVDEMVKQLVMQRGVMNMPPLDPEEAQKQAIEELVNNQLVIAKANELGIQVTFTEVEKAVDQAIEDNKKTLGGTAAFNRQLKAEGLTLDGLKQLYREQIRNRMLVERVLSSEIDRSGIEVTEEELHAAYEARGSELPMRPAVVHLATIFFSMESSENAKAAAKKQIDEIHRRVLAGEDFAELAKEYSEDPSAQSGGALGSLKLDDLSNREFAVAAATLEVGEVSEPVLTPFGYHLIKVTGKNPDTGEVELSHILVRIKPDDADVAGVYDQAQNVHQMLVDGADFGEMARKYSNDTATAASGGDLGWLKSGDLPEFFREVLADMKVGDLSQVLREPAGFRIVKLLGAEEARPYTFEELHDELKKYVEQQRIASKFNDYIAALRDEFYVDVRM